MEAHPALQAKLNHATLERRAQPAKVGSYPLQPQLRIAGLQRRHRLQHFVYPLVFR
jgi:hypothetical protein